MCVQKDVTVNGTSCLYRFMAVRHVFTSKRPPFTTQTCKKRLISCALDRQNLCLCIDNILFRLSRATSTLSRTIGAKLHVFKMRISYLC